jgi:hypothetical protein
MSKKCVGIKIFDLKHRHTLKSSFVIQTKFSHLLVVKTRSLTVSENLKIKIRFLGLFKKNWFFFRNFCFREFWKLPFFEFWKYFGNFRAFRTFPNSRKSHIFGIFAIFANYLRIICENCLFFAIFVFASFGKYEKITNENNEKNDVHLVSSRLAKNSFRLETLLEFRKKVRNAGPYFNARSFGKHLISQELCMIQKTIIPL